MGVYEKMIIMIIIEKIERKRRRIFFSVPSPNFIIYSLFLPFAF